MDLIKIVIEQISRGHVRVIDGICVLRIGNRYIVGETINIRSTGVDINEASRMVYELCRG